MSPQYVKRLREPLCHSMRHSQDRLPVALYIGEGGGKKFARRLNRVFFLIPLHWAAAGNLQMLYFLPRSPRSLPRLPSPMAFSDIKLLLCRLLKGSTPGKPPRTASSTAPQLFSGLSGSSVTSTFSAKKKKKKSRKERSSLSPHLY